jgi:hypothetical protein
VIFGGVRMLNAIGLENSSGCLLGPVPYRFSEVGRENSNRPEDQQLLLATRHSLVAVRRGYLAS